MKNRRGVHGYCFLNGALELTAGEGGRELKSVRPVRNRLIGIGAPGTHGGKMEKSFRQELSQLAGTAERMTAAAAVPGDSAWYAGHFPDDPILPGIAILALVKEAIIATELREGRRVVVTGVSRIRFRLPVKPDDRMTFEITREEKRGGMAYLFSVNLAGEAACTGVFTARLADGPGEQTS